MQSSLHKLLNLVHFRSRQMMLAASFVWINALGPVPIGVVNALILCKVGAAAPGAAQQAFASHSV
jgi:hypothetical protein